MREGRAIESEVGAGARPCSILLRMVRSLNFTLSVTQSLDSFYIAGERHDLYYIVNKPLEAQE